MILAEKNGKQLTDFELTEAIKEQANLYNMDLNACSSSQFGAILQAVSSEYIDTPLDILKLTSNNNIEYNYNYDYVVNLLNYYITISNIYNKAISIFNFSILSGIPAEYIGTWEGCEVTSKQYFIFKKLTDFRENFIKNKCIDSNNITGAIAVGNTEYKWNGGSTGNTTINIVSGSDLPNLLQGLQAQPLPAPKE